MNAMTEQNTIDELSVHKMQEIIANQRIDIFLLKRALLDLRQAIDLDDSKERLLQMIDIALEGEKSC